MTAALHDAGNKARLGIGSEALDGGLDQRGGDGIGVGAPGLEDQGDACAGLGGIAGGADLDGGGEIASREFVERRLGAESLLEIGAGVRGPRWTRQQGNREGQREAGGGQAIP